MMLNLFLCRSLALLMALLSISRETTAKHPSLLLVPTNHLAVQYFDWVSRLTTTAASPSPSGSSRNVVDPSIAQILIRDSSVDQHEQIEQLSSLIKTTAPPQLVIATPQLLVDLLYPRPPRPRDVARGLRPPKFDAIKANKTSIRIRELLNRVRLAVLDEADAQLSLPSRYAIKKKVEMFERHIPPAVRLIGEMVQTARLAGSPAPRLVFLSATATVPLRKFIARTSNWVDDGAGIDWLDGTNADPGEKGEDSAYYAVPKAVSHYLLEVSPDGRIRNDAAAPVMEAPEKTPEDLDELPQEPFSAMAVPSSSEDLKSGPPIPVEQDPTMLTALATVFALEQVSSGLLFVPSGSSVDRVVEELRALDVPAARLENVPDRPSASTSSPSSSSSESVVEQQQQEEEQDPIIYVTTPTFARGIDIPDLTHVFLSSISPDPHGYSHMAGRVGRFGDGGVRRPGKVISVVHSSTKESVRTRITVGRVNVKLQRLSTFY
jgi:superfamily II DNA/RNA helicase